MQISFAAQGGNSSMIAADCPLERAGPEAIRHIEIQDGDEKQDVK